MPMPALPNPGIPPSVLSYGPETGLYPNLPQTGPNPGGIFPPNIPQPVSGPYSSRSSYPADISFTTPCIDRGDGYDSEHRPFPLSPPRACPSPPHIYLSHKEQKKIEKAEHKMEKKVYKAQKKAEKKVAKAMRKQGISTGAAVGIGLGIAGAGTLAYAAGRRGSCSSCSSSTSSSSSD
ncbi:hypothetical protein HHI36_000645 [Cryptolaemus montrouzieri]|uniref:Uncharacterized protein n=1 Tax=Cryptolaemus montrouzieri TaxID=559131 RepID=A0ABD2P622_9CUCU